MESKHQFEMLVMDLNENIGQATQDRDESAEARADKLQAKATAEGDLADTTATRDADAKYLKDLTATCQEKETTFNERQALRADEIASLEEAIKIISSGDVA